MRETIEKVILFVGGPQYNLPALVGISVSVAFVATRHFAAALTVLVSMHMISKVATHLWYNIMEKKLRNKV